MAKPEDTVSQLDLALFARDVARAEALQLRAEHARAVANDRWTRIRAQHDIADGDTVDSTTGVITRAKTKGEK